MQSKHVLLFGAVLCLSIGLVGTALSVPAAGSAGPSGDSIAVAINDTEQSSDAPPDPPTDRLGWEQGYWYNESIDVDQSDGLSAGELRRYKARTMARLERIRGLEFEDDVAIEFIAPEDVPERVDRNVTQFRGSAQQWEALFVVGEQRNTSQVLFDTLVGNVGGWAAEEGVDNVVLITADPATPRASYRLLAHELVHVLQDQQFDLSDRRYQRRTMDGEHAKDAVVEGEARYVTRTYSRYCSNGTWNCLDGGRIATGPGSGETALLSYLVAPYSLGSQYVGRLIEQDGFDAVDAVHRDPPRYSVATLRGGVAPESPLSVPDRSSDAWDRSEQPDRVGAMALRRFAGGVNHDWRNGALYPYTNGSAHGYVWETRWATAEAATEFADRYRQTIGAHGGSQVADGTWTVPDGPFADAFAINRTGRTVRLVNAPTVETLSAVHAGNAPNTQTPSTSPTTSPTTGTPAGNTTAADDGPGFGLLAALFGVLVGIVVRTRTS